MKTKKMVLAVPVIGALGMVAAAPAPQPFPAMAIPAAQPAVPADEPGIHYVTSPIVGTFYASPGYTPKK